MPNANADPLRPRIYSYPLHIHWAGVVLSVCVIAVCFWMIWMVSPVEENPPFAYWLVIFAIVFFALFATACGWFLWKKPVALCFDKTGLRGRNLPKLAWDEIEQASVYGAGRYMKLGLLLKDPNAYQRRMSLWEKQSRLNVSFAHDVVISLGLLTPSRDEIDAALQAFLAQSKGTNS